MAWAGPNFPSGAKDGDEHDGYRYEEEKQQWRLISRGTCDPNNPVDGDMRGIRLVSDKYGQVLERGGLPWRSEITDDGFDPQIYYNGQWIDIMVPVTKQVPLKDLIREELSND